MRPGPGHAHLTQRGDANFANKYRSGKALSPLPLSPSDDRLTRRSLAQGETSKASTTMEAPVEAGFFNPVTWIVNVWLPATRPGKVKTAF